MLCQGLTSSEEAQPSLMVPCRLASPGLSFLIVRVGVIAQPPEGLRGSRSVPTRCLWALLAAQKRQAGLQCRASMHTGLAINDRGPAWGG